MSNKNEERLWSVSLAYVGPLLFCRGSASNVRHSRRAHIVRGPWSGHEMA